jgi:hypothetical protein
MNLYVGPKYKFIITLFVMHAENLLQTAMTPLFVVFQNMFSGVEPILAEYFEDAFFENSKSRFKERIFFQNEI